MLYGIGNEQELRTILIYQRQTMRTRKLMPPGIQQLAWFIIDQYIVFCLVGQQ